MPTLISEEDVRLERGDLLRRIPLQRSIGSDGFIVPPARTHGLHLSGLLKYVAHKAKITPYLEQIADEDLPIRWAIGQAWEEFAVSLYPDMLWQPGEVSEPVIMTCDGVDGPTQSLQEFKFNRAKKYSGKDLIAKKWLWMQQGMGYCLGYGMTRVCWHVLSAVEWPDPVYTKYTVEFSKGELYDSRRMILSNRDAAIREGYAE